MNADDLRQIWATQTANSAPYITDRYRRLDFFWKVYRLRQYDCLPYPFHAETDGLGNYIPLRSRRPAVRYNLAKIVVKKSSSMIFSGRNWPQIASSNQEFSDWLDVFYDKFNFSEFWTRVASIGCIGSVVPIFRIDAGNKVLSLDVWNARDCVPTFSPNGDLLEVMYKYITTTSNLVSLGVPPPNATSEPVTKKWWYRRKLTTTQDITYVPTEVNDWDESEIQLIENAEHTYSHNLNLVPAVWIRNLPSDDEDTFDGACTFEDVVDFFIEIDYQLSQCGRGLKYNSDPEVVLKEPLGKFDGSGPNVSLVRSTSNVITVDAEHGDAKLLEMKGTGQKVAIEYVEKLRNLALEVLRGSRKDPQRALSHAQSGKLAEMLEDDLISLGGELRISYGKGGLIPFTHKILYALKQYGMGGSIITNLDLEEAASIALAWGPWFEPTSTDHVQLQQALETAVLSERLDVDSARRITYHAFGMVPPKQADYEEVEEITERIERAKNAWQFELAKIKAAATALVSPGNKDSTGGNGKEKAGNAGRDNAGKKKSNGIDRKAAKDLLKGIEKGTAVDKVREEKDGDGERESGGVSLGELYPSSSHRQSK